MNGTIYDLYDLELAYQPYFATTEDPNNVLGSQAINILENRLKHVRISKLKDEIAEYEIYDLRGQEAYDKDHIKNAKLLSATDIRDDHKKIPKDKKILIYDENGISASKTLKVLKNLGFDNVYILDGGMLFFRKYNKYFDLNLVSGQ